MHMQPYFNPTRGFMQNNGVPAAILNFLQQTRIFLKFPYLTQFKSDYADFRYVTLFQSHWKIYVNVSVTILNLEDLSKKSGHSGHLYSLIAILDFLEIAISQPFFFGPGGSRAPCVAWPLPGVFFSVFCF